MMYAGVILPWIFKSAPELLLYVFKCMMNSLHVLYIALSHNYCIYLYRNISTFSCYQHLHSYVIKMVREISLQQKK